MRVVLLTAFLAASVAGADRLPPVDESTSDPSFLAFKVRLLAALQRKDVAALTRALLKMVPDLGGVRAHRGERGLQRDQVAEKIAAVDGGHVQRRERRQRLCVVPVEEVAPISRQFLQGAEDTLQLGDALPL